jgi:CsoR family transcriptional regulator, copper-sensing transcriptional repressor
MAKKTACDGHEGAGAGNGNGCCASTAGRKTVAVDPESKALNLKRLRRVEGQIRGIQKMVEADRYCADVLTQIGAVQEALRAVGRELMRHHLRHCSAEAFRAGGDQAQAASDELIELMYRNAK